MDGDSTPAIMRQLLEGIAGAGGVLAANLVIRPVLREALEAGYVSWSSSSGWVLEQAGQDYLPPASRAICH